LTLAGALPTFRHNDPRAPAALCSERARLRSAEEVSMAVTKVSDANFETEVLGATEPVVVDFWAEWCGPCRMIAPALEEISGTLGEKVKIVKLNVDENPATASKYGIMSIPTLMLFKNGQLASRQVGAAPKQKLEQWINGAV
jgi:thioredoxin 1